MEILNQKIKTLQTRVIIAGVGPSLLVTMIVSNAMLVVELPDGQALSVDPAQVISVINP